MSSVSRRASRVFAMQVLYAMEVTASSPGEVLPGVLNSMPIQDELKNYGMSLVDLALEHREELLEIINSLSHEWSLDRMPILDKTLLKIAFVEFLYKTEVPTKVIISEAVQIANKYSTSDSARFINGILDAYAKNKKMIPNQDED
ncbi:MAG: transcription antitermination factor NusB [Fibrobacter sp.]|jgi:N utilization substance protein B|nr:transcription antitermination factor NusB [Fibrobacter sp.]